MSLNFRKPSAAQPPITFNQWKLLNVKIPKEDKPGQLVGVLGPYTWQFVYERTASYDRISWDWGFAVYQGEPGQTDIRPVYTASAEDVQLWFDSPTVEALIDFVQYQAQVFLEEYLHQRMDAGSGSRHPKPWTK